MLFAAASASCQQKQGGAVDVIVIGATPQLRDPAVEPLREGDRVLLTNVAQGLVRFDATGDIVSGLAERWNVSDDGMSYIFRLAAVDWPDGTKLSAQQVARLLKRQLSARSKNPLKDTLGAIEDVVAMTDRVIEIRLIAPRPNLLPLLAQPELAVVRNGHGTGPFSHAPTPAGRELRLMSQVMSPDQEVMRREEVLLRGARAPDAIEQFVGGHADLVLGGTAADLPFARRIKLPRNSLRFDPAAGLFGLLPLRANGPFADTEVRSLLSRAIDRDAFVAALGVPGLTPRATVLEPDLDGVANPVQPAWFGVALASRQRGLQVDAQRIFGHVERPPIRVYLPDGPGMDLLVSRLTADWGAIGFTVERAKSPSAADFRLIDAVAPSSSPAWFLRSFRCGAVPVCDKKVDEFLLAARTAAIPAQRYALLYQASGQVDGEQLFIPLMAPVRWSLVVNRVNGFAGNRYALHTLTDLDQRINSRGE